MSGADFPYIDDMLAKLDLDAPRFEESFSQNIHFGFWLHPTTQAVAATLSDYKKATDTLTEQALRMAEVRSKSHIVDIGCGFGGVIHKLNQKLEQAELVGLNIDARQVAVARQLCGTGARSNQISFTVADARNTKLPNGTFDTALALECIFHMRNRARFFHEAFRILKPGGSLLITEIIFLPSRLPSLMFELIFRMAAMRQYKANIGTLGPPGTLSSYRRLARKSGFVIAALEDWSANIAPTFASLKLIKQDEPNQSRSLYAPQLLDFGEAMIRKGAHKYLAIRLRKPDSFARLNR